MTDQQVQPLIAVKLDITDTMVFRYACQFINICRKRVEIQMLLKQRPVTEFLLWPLVKFALPAVQDQRCDFIHQAMIVEACAIPFEHGEFRIVVPAGFTGSKYTA